MRVIADANYLLHRVLKIGKLNDLKNRDGVRTGGLFGVLNTLRTALQAVGDVSSCVFVWDGGISARRRSALPEYKGGRERDDDYLQLFRQQRDLVMTFLPFLGVRQVRLSGKEADDVIYRICSSSDFHLYDSSVVLTEDKDLLQMVGPDVSIYRPMRKDFVTEETFEKTVGVPADQFLLYLAIMGDKVDAIPGIAGVGDKTAKRVVRHFEQGVDIRDNGGVERLRELCGKLSSDKRNARRYASLSKETDAVLLNLYLMDLSIEEFAEREESLMASALSSPLAFSEDRVRQLCSYYSLASISDGFSWWIGPFKEFS